MLDCARSCGRVSLSYVLACFLPSLFSAFFFQRKCDRVQSPF